MRKLIVLLAVMLTITGCSDDRDFSNHLELERRIDELNQRNISISREIDMLTMFIIPDLQGRINELEKPSKKVTRKIEVFENSVQDIQIKGWGGK